MHAAALQAQAVQHADARLAHDGDVSRSAGTHMAQLPPLPGSDLQGDVQQRLALFIQVNGPGGRAPKVTVVVTPGTGSSAQMA